MTRRKKRSIADVDLLDALVEAARDEGCFVPETVQEVDQRQLQADSNIEPVGRLPEAHEVLAGRERSTPISGESRSAPANANVVENLVRVAREGEGRLPEEVVERMRQDRHRAELIAEQTERA